MGIIRAFRETAQSIYNFFCGVSNEEYAKRLHQDLRKNGFKISKNPYLNFCNEMHLRAKRHEFSDLNIHKNSMIPITRFAGKCWNQLTPQEKQRYALKRRQRKRRQNESRRCLSKGQPLHYN